MNTLRNDYLEWKKYYDEAQSLDRKRDSDWMKINQLLEQGVKGNFQGTALYNYSLYEGVIFFPFHDVVRECDGRSEKVFMGRMWNRMKRSVLRRIELKKDSERKEKTLLELYYSMCGERLGYSSDSAADVSHMKELFNCWLANQFNGSLMERRTVDLLRAKFGNDAVRYSDNDMEKRDIDVLVGGVPVSLKSYGAFNDRKLNSYRGKVFHNYSVDEIPKLFVNEFLASAVPVRQLSGVCGSECDWKVPGPGGKYVKWVKCPGGVPAEWEYVRRGADELESVLISLGAKNLSERDAA